MVTFHDSSLVVECCADGLWLNVEDCDLLQRQALLSDTLHCITLGFPVAEVETYAFAGEQSENAASSIQQDICDKAEQQLQQQQTSFVAKLVQEHALQPVCSGAACVLYHPVVSECSATSAAHS